MSRLTERQVRFVEQYLVSGNATAAAKLAGYSKRSAHVTGPRLLGNAEVAGAIAEARRKRNAALEIDATWVLQEAVTLYQRCIQEVRPALHPRTRQQLKSESKEPLFTFNAPIAARALELIGKHVSVSAFQDNVAIHGQVDLVARLQAGRARLRQARVIEANRESGDV